MDTIFLGTLIALILLSFGYLLWRLLRLLERLHERLLELEDEIYDDPSSDGGEQLEPNPVDPRATQPSPKEMC
jgi:hypothetical protein